MDRVIAPPETIGPCEVCGVTDHHLVEGVCPSCRPRCTDMREPAETPPENYACDIRCLDLLGELHRLQERIA